MTMGNWSDEEMEDIHNTFLEVEKELEKKSEDFWESLSKDQQLDAFCAVARRIHKGEIEEQGSYRYVLYEVFGFGPEAYMAAQLAGYLDIHNSIYTPEEKE